MTRGIALYTRIMAAAPAPTVAFAVPAAAKAVPAAAAAAPTPTRTALATSVPESLLTVIRQQSTAVPHRASSPSLFADLQSAITATNAQGSVNRALVERLLLAL